MHHKLTTERIKKQLELERSVECQRTEKKKQQWSGPLVFLNFRQNYPLKTPETQKDLKHNTSKQQETKSDNRDKKLQHRKTILPKKTHKDATKHTKRQDFLTFPWLNLQNINTEL